MLTVNMQVNGNPVGGEIEDRTLLATFLRENLRLTGTHIGCDTSQCGACVVHEPVRRLCRARGWQVGEILHHAGRHGRWLRGHHHRRRGQQR